MLALSPESVVCTSVKRLVFIDFIHRGKVLRDAAAEHRQVLFDESDE